MRVKDAVGRFGEDVAARHLESAGCEIVERNWRCADGEIDIVAREGGVLVICEVKTRSSVAYGYPAEAVGWAKTLRLRRLALRWLEAHSEQRARNEPLRFDVVSVLRGPAGLAVEHIRAAF